MRLPQLVLCVFGVAALTAWRAVAAPEPPETVHVIFKTHLDVGFTDAADRVVDKYVSQYIPQAIQTAKAMRAAGSDRYIWTTGSWVIDEYLARANAEQRQVLENAIREDDIAWHAYPFSGVNELLDPSLFRFTVSLAKDLDRQYGKETLAAKLTDVPGETRGVVPILAEQGIRFLQIGVNKASTPPGTPPIFRWRDPSGAEVVVLLQSGYGGTMEVPGCRAAVHFAFTGDNKGPHTVEAAQQVFADLRARFPKSTVKASTMNEFAREVWAIRHLLPEVRSEIGSTWVHSAGTDPKRYGDFRALMRLRAQWLADGRVRPDDPRLREFSRQLMMVVEHTGGRDEKLNLDFDHWNVDELAQVRTTKGYRAMEESWAYARSYLNRAVDALGEGPLAAEARAVLAEAAPRRPDTTGFSNLDLAAPLTTAFFNVRIDRGTGAIVALSDRQGRKWVDERHPLGLFWHESFSEADYERFMHQYLLTHRPWALRDFGKPNIGKSGATHAKRLPRVTQALQRQTDAATVVLLRLQMDEVSPTAYGLPREVWLNIEFPSKTREIRYTLQWFDKKAVRLPDAYWFSCALTGLDPAGWTIEKIGERISPHDVVSKGGRSLHAFNRGVFYGAGSDRLALESLDCPIVAPGSPALLDFTDEQPDLSGGWHFNLFNSKWGTNFPTWYDDDAKFRFVLRWEDSRS